MDELSRQYFEDALTARFDMFVFEPPAVALPALDDAIETADQFAQHHRLRLRQAEFRARRLRQERDRICRSRPRAVRA